MLGNTQESKYFYLDNEIKKGPYTLEELENHKLNRRTMVWYFGLDDWTPAEEIAELKSLFVLSPPPLPHKDERPVVQETPKEEYRARHGTAEKDSIPKPKTYLAESILVTLFCCLPFGIAGIVNASRVDSLYQAGDITEAKEASKKAFQWTSVGFWVGLVFGLFYVIVVFALDL